MAFEVPHRAMLLATCVSAFAALGGCADAEHEPAPVARSTSAPTSASPAAPAQADAGGLADVGYVAPFGDVADVADTGTVLAEDTSPPRDADAGSVAATWRCAESDATCACYDLESGAGYPKPACTNVFPCCVRFVGAQDGGGSYRGCSCYSDAVLAAVGRSCSGQVDRVNAIPGYTGAAAVSSCPGT